MILSNGPRALIERWSKPYTVTRTFPRSYTAGRVDAAVTETVAIRAYWEPAEGGRAGELLSSGTRVNEGRKVWTRTLLYAGVPGREADVIAMNGKNFEVQSCEEFADQAGFYVAQVTEV